MALCCAAMLALFPASVKADTFEDASRLMKEGKLGQALEKTDQILAANPKNVQARFLKGLILTEMNRANDAIAIYTKLTEDHPELPEPYNNLAVLYARQGQYEKARNALEMAIRTHPSYATAHENLGNIYARMASLAYDKALQIDSTNTGAQTKLAMIRVLMSTSARPVAAGKTHAADVTVAKADSASGVKSEPMPVAKPEPTTSMARSTVVPLPAGTKAESVANDELGVEKALRDWVAAWSRKDLKAYFASYAPDFQTPGGETRSAWEAERRRRIDKPEPIQVTIENLRIAVNGDHASVKFRQYYRSGKLKTATHKTMTLARRDGRWLIQQERVGN